MTTQQTQPGTANGAANGAAERFSPDTRYFSLFHLTANAAEAQLLVGRARIVVGAGPSPSAEPMATEWLVSLAMSPVTMKDLARKLAETVASYEQTFGPIADIPGSAAAPAAA
ncbi:hypothetical protein [Inquilinus limosus]|uniref:DUF3467 domain-containing protein n=1 Tax=Inquilinus limosus MP06 TaxID=1398085 RepID=A0A0A0CZP7_9PROT|nr:hypothetical protein [Inquilinus limosus]KGM31285.1 hypothetical protein P409_28080 [Inquilinus limosus MP06]